MDASYPGVKESDGDKEADYNDKKKNIVTERDE